MFPPDGAQLFFSQEYQIRTLDKSRLVKLIGELGITEIEAIEKAIKIHLEL